MKNSISKPRILVVEDQEAMRNLLTDYLEQNEFEVVTCGDASDALEKLGIVTEAGDSEKPFSFPADGKPGPTNPQKLGPSHLFDVVLTDVKMPGMNGLNLCKTIHEHDSHLPVIVMTAYGSMETSIEALRSGAFDFVTKPVELELLKVSLARATENSLLRRYVRELEEAAGDDAFHELIGQSEGMQQLKDQLLRIADSNVSVLLTGESGSGKEVVAQSLHAYGHRSKQPFIAVNCAALPDSLLESELFGHVKGAFTDAREDREGLFLQADGGTLFLDEIGEMPLEMQPKLLRALEEKKIRPVGGSETYSFDVRLVTATNRDLLSEVEAKRFREDLYYRINVLEISIPPLRTRGTDVLLLASFFLDLFARQANKEIVGLEDPAAKRLLAYNWPGNVRELRNTIERAVVLARQDQITTAELPDRILNHQQSKLVLGETDNQPLLPLSEVEMQYIRYALHHTNGNKTEAAKILGLDRKTLYRKLKEEENPHEE
ncbi:MAG: sigma-54 dependent transcriptional regulator [Pirellulaceae bacterium]|nr:sigma-54 dependent transcriptional regulator [Pirellulaceae bacterium]MDG2105078.1 sigma-54 dependent transcriptional regulator [Pirellulaceae bacterium]